MSWRLKHSTSPGRAGAQIADEIHAEVCERGFDRELNSFVQAYGSKRLDASLLLIPLVGFLPAADPRIQGTLRAIEDKLLIDRRIRSAVRNRKFRRWPARRRRSFFGVQLLAGRQLHIAGRYAEARKVFDRLLSRCNDVGLFAEEFDPLSGRMLGNFPQAYSHVGLINCALNLSRQTGPAEERSEILGLRYHHSSRPRPAEFSHVLVSRHP